MKQKLFYLFLGVLLAGPLCIYFTAKSIECPECIKCSEVIEFGFDARDAYMLQHCKQANVYQNDHPISVLLREEWIQIGTVVYEGHWVQADVFQYGEATKIFLDRKTGSLTIVWGCIQLGVDKYW